MRFYRVSYQSPETGEQAGYEFFTSRAGALRSMRESEKESRTVDGCTGDVGTEIEEVEVTPTKQGILRALNWYASHPDNG